MNLDTAQIVFVDTPGIHSFKDKLASHLNTVAQRSIEGCDLIVYVVDLSRRPGSEEERIIKILSLQEIKIVMVLNKVDRGEKFVNDYIDLWQKRTKKAASDSLAYYIPLSAKTGKNIERLKDALLELLPEGHAYYDHSCSSDFPQQFRVADAIREKLFLKLNKELPHSLAVEVSEVKPKKKGIYVKVNIYVKRNSQKKIVVGKNGQLLKEVGSESRPEIENIFRKKVFLDIWVSTLKDWQDRPRILKQLGYWWV